MDILKNIRELDIASEKFNFSDEISRAIDYTKWVEFIESNDFIWFERTDEGITIIEELETIPNDFRSSFLTMLNKVRCFRSFNIKKGKYEISVGYSKESKKVSISFERAPKVEDLRLFLEMANYLDALLLKDGKEIIDEDVIKALGQGE